MKEQREPRCRLRKGSPSPFLAAVLLTIGAAQSAGAYEFTKPQTPTLPDNLPTQKLEVTPDTPKNVSQNPGGSGYDWYGSDRATGYDVHVTRTSNTAHVFGGWSSDGTTVQGNRIVIENAGKMGKIFGGYSKQGDVVGNIVEIYGATSSTDMPGIRAGTTGTGNASKNMVFIRSGGKAYGTVTAGYVSNSTSTSSGTAKDNIIVAETGSSIGKEGEVTATVTSGLGTSADNNIVFMYGKTYGNIYGGQAMKSTGTANRNLVYVGSGALVSSNVFAAYGNLSSLSDASNNVVVIEDATVEGHAAAVSTNDYTGQGNELHLLGRAVVLGGAGANYDGWQNNDYRDTTTGLVHVKGTAQVGSLEGFNELVFELTDENATTAALTITNQHKVLSNQDPVLDLTSVATLVDGSDLTDPGKGASLIALASGQTLCLLINENTSFSDETSVFVDQTWTVPEEISAAGSLETENVSINTNGELVSSLNGVETILGRKATTASSESKTLAESFLGTIAFINQGAEFVADEGLRAMQAAADPDGFRLFGAVHGGTSRYQTGSHVDVDGFTLVTGAVTESNGLLMAAFVEAGWARSESHVRETEGDGDHDYYGIGAAMRYRFESPVYVDASVRFGKTSTQFNGSYADALARYDADGLYGSMHVGTGVVFELTKALSLDLYGRYVLTYLEGDKTGLHTSAGETFDMDDTLTHAMRIGTRLTGALSRTTDWRAGIAYEHVADGDAESSVILAGARSALEVPTLEGDTGILELGLTVRPSETNRWFADFSLKGYAGDRKGISGNTSLGYTF